MVCGSVLVTGTSRGLGLELVRQLTKAITPPEVIIATCRNPNDAQELQELAKKHKQIHILKLDVLDEPSYGPLSKVVGQVVEGRGLNLLINNAGVAPKSTRINQVQRHHMLDTYLVNTVAPVMLTKALLPELKVAASQVEGDELSVRRAAVINISSTLGSVHNNTQGGLYPYRASKCALNAITRSLSVDLRYANILVSSVCPGWVQTDMGGKNATFTKEQSISNLLRLLNAMNESHNGGFYQQDGGNGVKLPW